MKNMNRYVRYALFYLAASVAMGLILYFLKNVFDLSGNGGISAVVPLIMGMQIGQWYFETSSEPPSPQKKWGDSIRFGALGFAISLVLAFIVMSLMPGLNILADVGMTAVVVLMLVLFAISVLCTRVGIGLGVKGALNSQQKT